jgi:hypothetical protein
VAAEQPQEKAARAAEPPTTGAASLPPLALPQSPQKTKRKKRRRLVRAVIIVVLVLLVLSGGAAAYGYYYFETNIQKPLSTMIHPVQRAKEESQLAIPMNSAVSGCVWNILLLGSDNDQKFNSRGRYRPHTATAADPGGAQAEAQFDHYPDENSATAR